MRTIRNLAWFLLAFGLTVWAGVASAQDLKPAERRVAYTGVDGVNRWYNKPMDYCLARKAKENPTATGYCLANPSGPDLNIQMPGTEVFTPPAAYRWWYGGCRTPTPASGQCNTGNVTPSRYCASGQTPVSGPVSGEMYCTFTAPPIECKADGERLTANWPVGTMSPSKVTYNPMKDPGSRVGGCCVKVEELKRCYSLPNSQTPNQAWCTFSYFRDGNLCSGGPEASGAEPPSDAKRTDLPPAEAPDNGPCPKGTVNAGLSHSGVPMCMGTGTDPKNKPAAPPKVETEKTDTAPDGTKTTTKTETITNSDGSKTTTTTVTITKPDGTKQVDQQKDTSKTPTNEPGKDDSDKEDEKYDLCKQNPHLTICQNSSVAGKCGEISCSGDAIQCATLRAAAAMQCQQQKDLEDLAKAPGLGLGNAIAQGSDPMQGAIDSTLKGTEIDLSKPSLDATGFVGAGACLAPITMTVVGRPVTASFDSVCQNIQPLRYAIMACAYILVYLLVSRSILQG